MIGNLTLVFFVGSGMKERESARVFFVWRGAVVVCGVVCLDLLSVARGVLGRRKRVDDVEGDRTKGRIHTEFRIARS